jgi:hypothetical protein
MTDNQKQDMNSNCPDWTNSGECDRNPDYMLQYCAKSCDEKIKNANAPKKDMNSNCPYWANIGECDRNPSYMLEDCIPSCKKKKYDDMSPIQQAYYNMDNIVNNISSVYNGKPLLPQVKATKAEQLAEIQMYQNLKDTSKIERIYNLKNMLDLNKSVEKINNGMLNETIKVYDEDAIDNVKTLNDINREIMTNDEIIFLNDHVHKKRNMIISIMKSIILYLFLMILPVLLMSLGNITILFGFIFIGVCAIITAIVIIVRYVKEAKDIARTFPAEIRDEALSLVKQTAKLLSLDNKKCISKNKLPKPYPNTDPNKKPPVNNSTNTSQYRENANEVYLDNSINVWKQGDVPEIGATLKGYNKLNTEEENANPEQYYKGQTNPKVYTCVWNGDPTKLTPMNKGTKFSTTVPCEFYPGFKSE